MNKPICDSCIFWLPNAGIQNKVCNCVKVEKHTGQKTECDYWAVAPIEWLDSVRRTGEMSEWISVDERLPEIDTPVFIWRDGESPTDGALQMIEIDGAGDIKKLLWRTWGNWCFMADITHWQPKTYPKPPEVETKKTCSTCALWARTSQNSGRCSHSFYCHRLCCCEDWKAKEPPQSCKDCHHWKTYMSHPAYGKCQYHEMVTEPRVRCDEWKAKC